MQIMYSYVMKRSKIPYVSITNFWSVLNFIEDNKNVRK